MIKLSAFCLLFITVNQLNAQAAIYPDATCFKFIFYEGEISDTNRLSLKIKVRNNEKDTILIPAEFIEGDQFHPLANIYTELQKFVNGKYRPFVDKHSDFFFGPDVPDPKPRNTKLNPGDSTELYFNLISRIGAFYRGRYKLRVHLEKIPINDPPIIYRECYTSRWFYFKVVKDMDYHELYYQ